MAPILAHRRARSERRRRSRPTVPGSTSEGEDMALTIAAQKPIHETHAVAEPTAPSMPTATSSNRPTLWEDYIDPQFRDRALRFQLDENGLEELEIAGQRSQMSRRGFPATLGAMGAPDLADMAKNPERTYLGEAPYGSMDPQERIDVLDAEHIDIAILYTTVGLLWEAEVAGPGAVAGVHEGLQPLDLRVLRRRAAPRPDRPPVADRPRRRGEGARAGRRRGRQGRLRRPVPPPGHAARPPRQRPGVRRRPGPRRAAGHPPDVRAAVDEGHAHGCVGERQAAAPAGVGRRRPTACATSSRRCSTTACSTSSRGSRSSCWSPAAAGSATGSTASTPSTPTRSSATACR